MFQRTVRCKSLRLAERHKEGNAESVGAGALKNPEKAEDLKRALLKVRDQIDLLYPES